MDAWAIGGTVLSGIGATISIWQAARAKSYRDEVVFARKHSVIIDLVGTLKQARDECRKIATPLEKRMRGIDAGAIIKHVMIAREKTSEYGHRFDDKRASELAVSIGGLLTRYGESDAQGKLESSSLLYQEVSHLVDHLAKRLDDNK